MSTTIDPKDRLNKLIDIHRRREAEPPGSAYCMNASCDLIPDVLEEHHGYHLVCYRRFTANLDRLKTPPDASEAGSSKRGYSPVVW